MTDSKQMNNEWAFRYFETTIVHSAKRPIVQDKHILPHYRRLNYRFNKMANQYKSIFQDIIQGTYRPEKKYRDTDNTANLHLHLEIYAEQIFKNTLNNYKGVKRTNPRMHQRCKQIIWRQSTLCRKKPVLFTGQACSW